MSLPKYYTISRAIIKNIKAGDLLPGMKVPSENEIIAHYKVSNTTARKVLAAIEGNGYVTRVKGKGTIVAKRDIDRSATKVLSFTRNMLEANHKPSTVVISGEIIKKGYASTVNGRRYTIKGPVFKLVRLRYADKVPMLYETRYINLELCPGITERDFTGSLYEIYESYGHDLMEIDQMLSAVMIDKEIFRFFDIKKTIPAFNVESVTFCAKEMILEMENSVYRGDKYRFSVRAFPEHGTRSNK